MTVELPKGWAVASLSQIGTWRGGGTPSKAVPEFWENGTIHWVSPKDMKRLLIDSAQDQITERAVSQSATNIIPERSVLMVTRSGILEHSFPVAVNTIPVAINQDLKAWTPSVAVDSVYAAYYLRSRAQNILHACSKDGTTVSSIDFDRLAAYPVAIAPSAEQARIVSKIDELFSEIEEGERALERVQKLVERYRQSVLKAAVTGELTREWRQDDAAVDEGCKLAAWREMSVRDIGTVVTGSTPPTAEESSYGGSLPFLKPTDLDQGYTVVRYRQALSVGGQKYCRPLPAEAVLVTCIGATIGKVGLARMPCATNQQINAVVVKPDLIRPKFLYWFFASPVGQSRVIGNASATTLPIINKSRFERIAIPLPPLLEQDKAVEEIEVRLGAAERALHDATTEGRYALGLRQAILRAAFSGHLVPQDSTDEPASVLIERINDVRAAEQQLTRVRSGRAKTKPLAQVMKEHGMQPQAQRRTRTPRGV